MLSKSWFTLWYARFCLGTFVGLVESYMLTTLCNFDLLGLVLLVDHV